MKEIVKLSLKLFIITLVAGILLGGTYFITKDPIAEQQTQEATLARQKVLSAQSFEEYDISKIAADKDYANITSVYIGKDAGGKTVGATIQMTAKGFKPGIVLTIGIKTDGTVSGVNVGSNEETPGLGAKAALPDFYEQYAGKAADGSLKVIKSGTAGAGDIMAIAGATVTSKGITSAVNTAAGCYLKYIKG